MVQTLDSGGAYVPKDLLKDTSATAVAANTAADKNVFTFVAPNLKTNSVYSFQFKYVFEDGVESDEWSPTYTVFTSNIATLAKPKLTAGNISYFQGILRVTWDGTDYNNTTYGNGFSRILIWVRDNTVPGQLFKIVGELSKPGTWSLAVPPKSQTVKLTAISVNGEESAYSDDFTITPVISAPIAVTGVTPAWSGTNFTLTFTHDPSNSANEYLKEYLITLNTATSGTKIFSLLPVSGTTQKFALSLAQNQAAFGTAEKSFSGTIETLDRYGNKGTAIPFTNTAYVSALTTPTLTVSAITNGYSVSYPTQTSNTFQFISVEEVVSSASTDPGTGYTGVATGTSNPLVVPTVNTNKRWVRAKLFDTVNESTGYSTAVAVTPLSPVTVDNDGPDNVASVTAVSGIDTSGYLGFNAYADISWPAVTGGGIRGYRIRFSNDNNTTFSYVDSPGSGTTYRLGGLAIGATYKIAVATYDEYNNTSSSYVAGPDILVTGTPAVTNYITGGPFQFGVGVGAPITTTQFTVTNNGAGSYSVNGTQSATLTLSRGVTYTFNVNASGHPFYIQTTGNGYNASNVFSSGVSLISGTRDSGVITFQVPQNAPDTLYYQCQFHPSMYGQINIINSNTGNKGLYFDESNYWYLNASNSARLKVGGSNSNYLYWDGATFAVDGNITARQGTFSGNVSIASGASIYSGTLTGNTVTSTGNTGGSLSGAGYILNSSGLTFNSASISGITTIDATTGLLTSQSANIGGWLISPSTNVGSLYKTTGTNTVKLDSAGYITVSGTGYQTGIGYPATSGADANIVMWAGADKANAPFKVFKDGSVTLTSATITGYASDGALASKADTNMGNVTSISGNKIRSGLIQSNNWNGTVTNGSDYSTAGMTIDLSTGAITSPKFRIDTSGNATFDGTISANNVVGGTLSGANINIGNGNFVVSSLGALTATSGTFNGNVVGGTFSLSGNQTYNYWSGGAFNAGNGTIGSTNATYVNINASTGKFTAYSSSSTQDNVDGSGLTTVNVPQLIEVNSSSIIIQGLAGVGNGLTAYGDLLGPAGDGVASTSITNYWSAGYTYAGREPSANYGNAARYRMIVADPYDYNKLKRGFGVYYGVRPGAPTASTGLVGDVWISW